jgi:hypothetical protein
MIRALKDIISNITVYAADYIYDKHHNHFKHKNELQNEYPFEDWFSLEG